MSCPAFYYSARPHEGGRLMIDHVFMHVKDYDGYNVEVVCHEAE